MSDLRKAAEMVLEALDMESQDFDGLSWSRAAKLIAAGVALREALAQPEQELTQNYVALLKEASEVIKSKPVYKRYIDGTPLANDLAVWMANFAMSRAAIRARSDP